MARVCCSCLVGLKIFVWGINFIVFMGGLLVALLATAFIFNYQDILYFESMKAVLEANEDLLEPWITNWHVTCFAVLAIGILIIVLGFVGCCGAAKEASPMLCCYMLLQIFITLSLMGAAICGYIFYDRIFDRVLETMDLYNPNNATAVWSERWNQIQKNGKCCGIQSALDWRHNQFYNESDLLPLSCCPDVTDQDNCNIHMSDSYISVGCTDTWLKIAAYPLVALSIFQIIAIISSGALRRQIRREKYYY